MNDYADLEIGLHHHSGNQYRVELRLRLPDSDADRQPTGQQPLLAIFDPVVLGALAADMTVYGKALTNSLFAVDTVRTFFAEARAAADSQNPSVPLRIRLYIGPSALRLHDLRWETLRDPQADTSLATDEKLLFSRYHTSDDRRPVITRPKSKLRVLVVIANPAGLGGWQLAPVDVTGELIRAQAGLDGISITTLCHMDTPGCNGRPTLRNLIGYLRDGYDILYLVCHGKLFQGVPRVWLEDDDGNADVISPDNDQLPNGEERDGLVVQLKKLTKLPRLIVLASCQSAGTGGEWVSVDDGSLSALGPRLAEAGVPAVVGMQGNITMPTAAEFVSTFFKELLRDESQGGGQIDYAVAVARAAVQARRDWWMPVLFMRIRDGRIWIPERDITSRLIDEAGAQTEHGVFIQIQHAEDESAIEKSQQYIESDVESGITAKQISKAIGHSRICGSPQKIVIRNSGRLSNDSG